LFQLFLVDERNGAFGGMRIGKEIEVLEENLPNATLTAENPVRTDTGSFL
jgi:hypothetical protein